MYVLECTRQVRLGSPTPPLALVAPAPTAYLLSERTEAWHSITQNLHVAAGARHWTVDDIQKNPTDKVSTSPSKAITNIRALAVHLFIFLIKHRHISQLLPSAQHGNVSSPRRVWSTTHGR